MGILDSIGAMAGDASQGDNAKVMGGLIQALESHPGGIQGILDSFQKNGLGDHAATLASGGTPSITSDQVQQGLSGTGLIEKAAEHAGVSPETVQTALTTVLPLVMSHFAGSGGTAGAESSGGISGMLQGLVGKLKS